MGLRGLTRLLELLELEQSRAEAANKHSAIIALKMSYVGIPFKGRTAELLNFWTWLLNLGSGCLDFYVQPSNNIESTGNWG